MKRTFREQLLKEMDRREMTGYELAKQSGVAETTISRYRRGKADITVETFERLASVLGFELRMKGDKR